MTSEERLKIFKQWVEDYRSKNPKKYPSTLYADFFAHWCEPSIDWSKMKQKTTFRFQKEPNFAVGKRLSTFWKRGKDQYEIDKVKEFGSGMRLQQNTNFNA